MSNTASSGRGGITFLGLLTIVFITLKLTNYIHWSWWLVTIPLWGGAVLAVIIVTIIIIGAAVIDSFK